ncbi:hypothetical protein [Niallia sp. NCCP-28]|uniref:hypothetical protein n=1 Tax=Niallia sp. NCCP-28 TaxID=2934712 RepID=UPI0020BE4542|nr:hypothetical protein [Niallia sp. NCCP-28]
MYEQIGLIFLILTGIPFIFLTVMLRFYHSSRTVNDYLKAIAELGYQLTQNLQVKETIDFFTNSLYKLFKVDFVLYMRVENKSVFSSFSDVLFINEGICGNVLATKDRLFIIKKWNGCPIFFYHQTKHEKSDRKNKNYCINWFGQCPKRCR